ncbi:MAG: Ppx/GppA family phosphatase [Acetobacter sp.]|nr:Ppx/GppA family phosphatase [Acetobacter sp.]
MPRRSAVVDLGSNSVRLVVFEGVSRNPLPIFNEKAVLRLGRGLTKTGCLNEEGVAMAKGVMRRFYSIVQAMNADPFEILATAAVREASNGLAFIESLQEFMPGVSIRVLSGKEEADYSAIGVLCGIPNAQGVVADVGGGSLELIHLAENGQRREATTLPLGILRLSDRAEGNLEKAGRLAAQDIKSVSWLSRGKADGLSEIRGETLYLVGGAFRALAKLQMARTQYPLNIVHYYTLSRQEACDMVEWICRYEHRGLECFTNISRRRMKDVPFAAVVLQRLIQQIQPDRVVFCVDGLREGWYMLRVAPSDCLHDDPTEVVAQEMCARLGRSTTLPLALRKWTDSLIRGENECQNHLRRLACLLSDIGSHEHPEYRAEQTYWRILRLQGAGFDHTARTWLALVLAIRYAAEKEASFLNTSRALLTPEQWQNAVVLGVALRLAYFLSGGSDVLLEGTFLRWEGEELVLGLTSDRVIVNSKGVRRRLEQLGEVLGVVTRFAVYS